MRVVTITMTAAWSSRWQVPKVFWEGCGDSAVKATFSTTSSGKEEELNSKRHTPRADVIKILSSKYHYVNRKSVHYSVMKPTFPTAEETEAAVDRVLDRMATYICDQFMGRDEMYGFFDAQDRQSPFAYCNKQVKKTDKIRSLMRDLGSARADVRALKMHLAILTMRVVQQSYGSPVDLSAEADSVGQRDVTSIKESINNTDNISIAEVSASSSQAPGRGSTATPLKMNSMREKATTSGRLQQLHQQLLNNESKSTKMKSTD